MTATASPSPAPATPSSPSPPRAGIADRVREFFLLHAAEREVRALPEPARSGAQRELSLAFQKRDAAETLWPRGSCAEALKLARASVDTAVGALESFATSAEARPEWVTRAQQIASTARDATAGRALPELEAEARADDEETFRVLIDAGLAIERVVGPHLAAPADIARLRRGRVASAALGAVALVLFVVWALHVPEFRSVVASSQHGEHVAERVVDHDTKTAWLLPDRTGFIELTLSRARNVHVLHVLPSDPPFNDRLTKDVHVDCFLGDTLARGTDFSFPAVPGVEAWGDIPIDAKCDRIKLDVKSFVGTSASIAEIELR